MTLFSSSLVILYVINLGLLAEAAYYHCDSSRNFTSGSDYGNSRDTFLQIMPAEVMSNNGFYFSQSAAYSNTSVHVYCLGLCRPDLMDASSDACSICIGNSSTTITSKCPVQMESVAWGEDAGCIVQCSPHDFISSTVNPVVFSCNASRVQPKYFPQFGHALANLTSSVAQAAADDRSNSVTNEGRDFPNYFGTVESKLGDLGLTIYALGLCLPTLSQSNCVACLRAAANESERNCYGKQGATIFTPSCILRYELYRFYESSLSFPSPSPPPPKSPAKFPTVARKEGRNRRALVTAVVLPVITIVLLTVIALVICVVNNLQDKIKQKRADEDNAVGEETTASCLEFSLNTIRVATNNFSPYNKLGQGGYGEVYKGCFPNGQQIAVKRLVVHSARGDVEFKNEVQLVAMLDHKNLIRLIGFCLQGKERILIYDALNGSLDRILFDPIRREQLNWEIRSNIIQGIARGMLYLHDESQLRIIHRDLKAGNILLDESMNAKISDFGTARLFVEDQSNNASRIVGTYGYMAPEYVKHGKISVKIDVFSFGVLVLEIVCGKKVSASENPEHIEHLLSKVWKYLTTGKVLKLIDPMLPSGQADEITRCIHIGLLCVQEDATCRPTMNSVVLMLECASQILPPPLKPAYFMCTEDDRPNVPTMDHHSSVSSEQGSAQPTNILSLLSSGFSSVNGLSITQPYPEPR